MVTVNGIFEFMNNRDCDMIFVIDPPCFEYTIGAGEKFKLNIEYEKDEKIPVLTFRYNNNGAINIDIDCAITVGVIINDIEDKVWG